MSKTLERATDDRVVKVSPDGRTADQINRLVANRLAEFAPPGYRLTLSPGKTGRYGGQWVVVVDTDPPEINASDHVNLLMNLRRAIRKLPGGGDVDVMGMIPPDYDPSEPEWLDIHEQGPARRLNDPRPPNNNDQ